jgi:ribosome-binding protein aMBF1 (putative translation factor)
MYGKCELCGRETYLEKHHVWGGALQKKSDELGATAYLCLQCHRDGKAAVHKSGEAARVLKAQTQLRIMQEQGWTTEQFIFEFGRNYIQIE